ncbi:MAG: transposase [Coleofasciculus sp. S288]|nr:transposase [Coleofasciculus sp. S288]
MRYDPSKHHRRSIRLKGYDYEKCGAYFITLCAWQRQKLFGEIENAEMRLNTYGEIIQLHWDNLPKHHHHLELDEFTIMPNHVHGIIILTDKTTCEERHGLQEIIRGFKTFSARRINKIRRLSGVGVWQRGYYEHIIRNEKSLMAIREYIVKNPSSWGKDELHCVHPREWDGQIKNLALQMNRIM